MHLRFGWAAPDSLTGRDTIVEERIRSHGIEIVSHINHTLLARLGVRPMSARSLAPKRRTAAWRSAPPRPRSPQ